MGASEYDDVRAGRLWLNQLAAVDGTRVGIHGLSYGGLNCLQALARTISADVSLIHRRPWGGYFASAMFIFLSSVLGGL